MQIRMLVAIFFRVGVMKVIVLFKMASLIILITVATHEGCLGTRDFYVVTWEI